MHGWRRVADGFKEAIDSVTASKDRPAPTTPFGDVDASGHRPLPGTATDDPMVREVMLGRIRHRDPRFDREAFLRGAVAAFMAIEGAWSDQDPQRSQRYLAKALWASHRSRMELYALQKRHNRLDGLSVRSATISGASTGDGPDRLTVRIEARSTDYDVDASGTVVRGDRALYDWKEDWVFQRSGTSTTPEGGGLLAQRCPGCGAPLELDDDGCCTSCRAPVMDGSRDWVVVAVERPDEDRRLMDAVLGVTTVTVKDDRGHEHTTTTVAPIANLDGEARVVRHEPDALAVIAAVDPDFAPDQLCDHVRSAFTALRSAWAAMDADRVRPFLAEPAYDMLKL
ncbi:MAG TPA: TIM44-like domain-containing protein, partial [Candidatus Dormibacteraeota bacterium]|nr:TIM44-like domain-containing protein [Candidatus Dormibacteraeota bacterium]